jgi:hypothetical protein
MYLLDFDRSYDILFGELSDVDENGYVLASSAFDTFGLIPEESFTIESPEVRSEEIDIPGAMGSRSLVNYLTGYPVFTNRQGNLSFITFEHTPNKMAKIYRKFHGRQLNLIHPNNPDFYYSGFFEVTSYKIDKDYVIVELKYNLEPYLYSRTENNIVLTNTSEQILTPEGDCIQPYMPTIVYTTEHSEYPTQFKFTNLELEIESTVTLQPGENHIGTQCIISNFNETNQNKFQLQYSNGSPTVIVKYRNCIL